jgi:hypothetical protein
LSGFSVYPISLALLAERPCLEQKVSAALTILDERIALLELENTHLWQQNKVLYKQNSDYRGLIQEYEGCCDKASEGVKHSKAVVDAIERITIDINANIESYETARGDVRRAERMAIRDWRRFAIENASIGIDVDKVAGEMDTMEITVYPYMADPNMI